MIPDLISLRWHLDEDGGGEALVAIDRKSHVRDTKYVFDSLDSRDQIPANVAAVILADGRSEGEIPKDIKLGHYLHARSVDQNPRQD